MTFDEIKDHLEAMGKADSLAFPDMTAHVARSARLGLNGFWGAHDWTFRCDSVELSLTSSAESYELPENFDQVRSIREKTTNSGLNLTYYIKNDFDMLLPKPGAVSTGTPAAFTIFRDNNKWYVSFLPKPSGAITLYLDFTMTPPSGLDPIPEKFHDGVLAWAFKNFFPFSHRSRPQAYVEARTELERLEKIDQLNVGRLTHFPDGTEEALDFQYSWVK